MNDFKKITREHLELVLGLHQIWLDSEGKTGKQADLSNTFLSGMYLANSNLSHANLKGAYIRYTNLDGCNLSDANLDGCDLYGCDLSNVIGKENNDE